MAEPVAVVFDLFGTLTIDQTATERHRRQAPAAEALGVPLDDLVRALRSSFTERATGAWGDAAQALRMVAQSLGADPTDAAVAAAVDSRLDAERALTEPRPGVLDLLSALHAADVPVGVLSDCTWEMAAIWPQLPYAPLVATAVFSVEMGARKPAGRMYAEVARQLSVDPGRVLYVGDGGSRELTGARRAAMRPVLLRASLDEPAIVQELRYDAEDDWDGEHVRDVPGLRVLLHDCGLLPSGRR